jgi:hypothetical protein
MRDEDALLKQIAPYAHTQEVQSIKRWIQHLLDEAKDALISADTASVGRLQGQADAYKKLLRRLDRLKEPSA